MSCKVLGFQDEAPFELPQGMLFEMHSHSYGWRKRRNIGNQWLANQL